MRNVGNETAHFVRMPNAQLDHLMDALEGKAVPILLVAIIVAGLLSLFLKWLHHTLFRTIRSAKAAREARKAGKRRKLPGFIP
jgi:hypothetical protein